MRVDHRFLHHGPAIGIDGVEGRVAHDRLAAARFDAGLAERMFPDVERLRVIQHAELLHPFEVDALEGQFAVAVHLGAAPQLCDELSILDRLRGNGLELQRVHEQ